MPDDAAERRERRVDPLARELRRAWRAVSRRLGALLAARPAVAVTDAGYVPQLWVEELEGAVLGHLAGSYLAGAGDLLTAVQLPEEVLVGDDLVEAYLRDRRVPLAGIADAVREAVRDQIIAGHRESETVAQVAARVRNVAQLSDARSLAVARTELHAAYESGAYEQARFVSPNATKRWLATDDDRTRASHRAADGQEVKISESFEVGGSRLRFPGDPAGDPDETINCRCSVAYDFSDTISPVLSVEGPQPPAYALVAAGKWVPSQHPRGKDGKFIAKGAVYDLLTKKSPTIDHLVDAVIELDQTAWDKLTPAQKTYIQDKSDTVGGFAKNKVDTLAAKTTPTGPNTPPGAKSAPVAVPAHKGAAPGTPAKVTTTLIWGKHEPGTVILETAPDKQSPNRVVWNGKKYEEQVWNTDGVWVTASEYTKKDAYATLKNDTHWVVPGLPKTEPGPEQPDWVDELLEPTQPKPTGWEGVSEVELQKQWEKGLLTSAEFEQVTGKKPSLEVETKPSVELLLGQQSLKDSKTYVVDTKHPDGTVIAMMVDGQQRLVAKNTGTHRYVRQLLSKDQDKWHDVDLVSNITAIVKIRSDEWGVPADLWQQSVEDPKSAPWTPAVTATPIQPPTPQSGKPGLSKIQIEDQFHKGLISHSEYKDLLAENGHPVPVSADWDQVISDSLADAYPHGSIIAETDNGVYQLMYLDAGDHSEYQVIGKHTGSVLGNFQVSHLENRGLEEQFGTEWVVNPPPKPVTETQPSPGGQGPAPDWSKMVTDVFGGDYPAGSVTAKSADGSYELHTTATPGEFTFVNAQSGESLGTFNDADIESGTVFDDTGWQLVPPPGQTTASPTTLTYLSESVITNWPGLLGKKFVKDDVVALHSDGNHRLVKGTKDMFQVQKLDPGGGGDWQAWETMSQSDVNFIMGKYYPGAWVVPPPKQQAPGKLAGTLSPATLFTGAQVGQHGDVIAFGKHVNGVEYKASVYDSPASGKMVWVELKNNTGTWSSLGGFDETEVDALAMDDQVTWYPPPADTASPSLGVPDPAPPTPDPVTDGADITKIPATHKMMMKAALKDAGVGYWSKAEKIYDQVDAVRKQFPDSDKPGHSLYTPLQVLKVLDQLTNTKDPSPYETKIVKWAATGKGQAHIASLSKKPAPGSGDAATPVPGVDAWQQVQDQPPGTVLTTGKDPSGKNFQLVVAKSVHGTKFAQVESKLPDGTPTKLALPTKSQLDKALTDNYFGLNIAWEPVKPAPAGLPNYPTTEANVNVTYTLKNNPKTSVDEIFAKLADAVPGQVLAYGKYPWSSQKYRLVVVTDDDGNKVIARQHWYAQFKQWTGATKFADADKLKTASWNVGGENNWVTAENAKITAPKKPKAVAVTPTAAVTQLGGAPVTPAVPATVTGKVTGLNMGGGDTGHLAEAKKQALYQQFKSQPATYLDSPEQDIFIALKTIADDSDLGLLQLLRVVDEVGAKKIGKPDEHLFEKKIKAWLQTPQGAAVASGKPIPLPDQPKFAAGVDPAKQVPSFQASNQYQYKVLPTGATASWWNEAVKASGVGSWTATQRAGLRTYTGGSYFSINGYLYGKLPTVSSTHMTALRNAQLGMRPSTKPVLLHRGVGYNGIANAKNHADLEKAVGTTWKSGGFFSTSVGGHAAFGGSVLIEVEAPPGTPMAWVDPISLHKGENEMLLAAGLSYRIISVKKQGSKSVVRVRVVPEEATV